MVDFLGLMKQATELKSKMDAMQAELERIEVEGSAGGGLRDDHDVRQRRVALDPHRRFAGQTGPEGTSWRI